MRELKFRAWIKGYNCYADVLGFEQGKLFVQFQSGERAQHRLYVPIEDSVLEQYTGLKDKNGTKIYEGDILHGEFYGYPFPCKETFIVKWHKANAGFLANYFNNEKCKVIGNIFDNPELLNYADNEASQQAHQEVLKPAT